MIYLFSLPILFFFELTFCDTIQILIERNKFKSIKFYVGCSLPEKGHHVFPCISESGFIYYFNNFQKLGVEVRGLPTYMFTYFKFTWYWPIFYSYLQWLKEHWQTMQHIRGWHRLCHLLCQCVNIFASTMEVEFYFPFYERILQSRDAESLVPGDKEP